MATLSGHSKIEDYTKWRKVYDEMEPIRRKFGMTSERVFRAAADPNEITVQTEWPSVEQARAYLQSQEFKDGMKKAGVVSQPDVQFLEAV